MAGAPELDAELADKLLHGYGLVPDGEAVSTRPLGGGVSGVVLLAEAGARRYVLKQPRSEFRVADRWVVDDRRVFVEHAFLRAVGPWLGPRALPRPVAFAPQFRVLVTEAAPPGWSSWKQRLLAGDARPDLGRRAGSLLARLHDAGDRPALAGRFRHPDLFDQQRLEPYFRTAAQRVAEAAGALAALEGGFAERDDLVHGDYSPKNLLTDGTGLMLLDHEVATRGDAAFDLAFLLTHLALKAQHLPAHRAALFETARGVLDAYESPSDPERPRRALAYLGGLLLARAVGKSPAEYLDAEGRRAARDLGLGLLRRPADDWSQVEQRLAGSAAR